MCVLDALLKITFIDKDDVVRYLNKEGKQKFKDGKQRDVEGDYYLGCLEVAQDITNIKKIEGEKRLL